MKELVAIFGMLCVPIILLMLGDAPSWLTDWWVIYVAGTFVAGSVMLWLIAGR